MKRRTLVLVCSLGLVLGDALPGRAVEHEPPGEPLLPPEVVIHMEHWTGPKGAEDAVIQGIVALWEAIEPYRSEAGLTEYPRTDVYVFSDPTTAQRVFGKCNETPWTSLGGCAYPGRMAVKVVPRENRLRPGDLISLQRLAVHEFTHVIQFALSGRRTPSCLFEGAARWYEIWILDRLQGEEYSLERSFSSDRLTGNMGQLFEIRPSDFYASPFIGFLYYRCSAAFGLLIETGGGHGAYFEYLAASRGADWRTAFDRSFDESFETFVVRLDRFALTDGADYRVPSEIALDEMLRRFFFECVYWNPRSICLN